MNSRLISACALTGIALTFFGAAPASATTFSGSIGFTTDSSTNRGDVVDILGTCDDPNFTTTPVISDILDAPDLVGTANGNGGFRLRSRATVKEDAPLGSSPVAFMCGDTKVSLDLLIETVQEPGTLEISPTVVRPGDKVTLTATCTHPEFTPPGGFESYSLNAPEITSEQDEDGVWHVTGTTTLSEEAAPGKGSVLFVCGPGGNVIVTEFTIAAPDAPPAAAQVPVKPKGAADTGSADIAATVAAPEQQDLGVLALGGLAVLAAGALAYRKYQKA